MKRILLILIIVALSTSCTKARRATVETTLLLQAKPEQALVSFVRGSNKEFVSIWDRESCIGFLIPRKILQAELTPGKHLFIARSLHTYDFVKADLAPGSHYIIFVDESRNGVNFIPIPSDTDEAVVKKWFKNYKAVRTMEQYLRPYGERQLPRIKKYIDEAEIDETRHPLEPYPTKLRAR